MSSRGAKRAHVLPAVGAVKLIDREKYWIFLSKGPSLPDPQDISEEKFSRVDSRILITSHLGGEVYIGELTGESWGICQRCELGSYCSAWDGIGDRLTNVPLGIQREGGRYDGNEEMLFRLGLSGPEQVRKAVNVASSVFNLVNEFFAIFGRPTLARDSQSALRNALDLLEIGWPATREEIESAFRRAAFRYHPDNKETGNEELFKKVSEARSVLISLL